MNNTSWKCEKCGNFLIKESISHEDGYEKSILSCDLAFGCGYKYVEEWKE